MSLINKYKFLLVILFLAAFLRLYKLGEVPVGPNWDEAALGYNAYSILKTGKDEYGTLLPLSLRSYDDYKPPLYMYLTVPSVGLFGLSLWSTRLPAAINGIVAVLGTFFLVEELITYSDVFKKYKFLPYISALLLALSPWHLQFSRMAFEANIGVTLNIWAIVFCLRGLKRKSFLALATICFGLILYAYHSQRIFAPLLVLVFSIVFRNELFKDRKAIILACIAGLLTVAPLIPVFFNPTTLTRLRGTSSVSDTTGLLRDNVKKLDRDNQNRDLLGKLIDNRRLVYATTILNGYLSHYSLKWLFLEGDNARHHAPGMGLLYQIELPFLLIGLVMVAKKGKKAGIFVLGWMIIAPVAASPTTELPHAIRTLVFLPTFQIVTAVGILTIIECLRKAPMSLKYGVYSLLILAAIGNGLYYFSCYYLLQNYEYSQYWQYGYKQAVEYSKNHYDEYKKIVVSTKLEQPHMFFLFHLIYDPVKYQAEGGTSSGGFAEVKNLFDKYEFRPIHWDSEVKDGQTLYIGKPSEISGSSLQTINYLDGTQAMVISR